MSQPNKDPIPDVIQDAVESCADGINKALGNHVPSFLAVHFICGKQGKPGLIRKSAIRLSDKFLKRISATDPKPDNRKHGDVLLNHVRLFDRKNTLLTLAMSKLKIGHTGLWLRIGDSKPDSIPNGWKGENLEWPDRIDEFLVPQSDAVQYLKQAYSPDYAQAPASRDEIFARQRAETYGRWLAARNIKGDRAWKSLHPLQSSLVYFAVACNDAMPTGDLFVFPLNPLDNSGITPVIAVVASGYSKQLEVEKIRGAITHAKFNDYTISDYLRKDKTVDYLGEAKKEIYKDKNLESQVKRCAEGIFPVPGHETRFELLFRWMALLIQRLRQIKHEGHFLDFWFVAGDASEFEDDPDIQITKRFQSQPEAAIFSPPQDGIALEDHLKKTCSLLEKEHFPWFSGGQHALFFDLSHKDMLARGLCGIRRSSWEFQLGDLYKSKQEQEASPIFPACLIGFVSARMGGAGVAICHPQAKKRDKKLRLLARLDKEGWRSGLDQRKVALKKVITSAYACLNGPDTDSVESFAQLCQLVADNPHAGGTFVLLNENKCKEFVRMGDPWDFGELTLSEQLPLISHDGATLLLLKDGKPEYHYRYMLTPEQLPPCILEKLAKVSKNHDSPLASVGTRRWSSAMAAFREGVEAVIVISQDGGITCYRSPGKNQWEETTVQQMKAGQKPGMTKALNEFIA